ncbi:MAG: arginine deiminase [Caldithrix sp.]|nr:arginine deiminase [Caldithrix sp.]
MDLSFVLSKCLVLILFKSLLNYRLTKLGPVMNNVNVSSEISPIKTVIIHTPGMELERMTPEASMELLYDDILQLSSAREQHAQLKQVLQKVCQPLEVSDLLMDILEDEKIKVSLVHKLCRQLDALEMENFLISLSADALAEQLILGTELKRDTLQRFLSTRNYALPPLPNFFYTRDSAMVVNNRVFIGNMANRIRIAEAIIMSHIFRFHPHFLCEDFLVDASEQTMPHATFEGGDILILQEDILLIGMSERTSARGIDYLIEEFKSRHKIMHVFVVILPKIRATIHLDMVFTMIDHDKAVVFPPLLLAKDAVDVIHINISHPSKPKLQRYPYIFDALRTVNINLEPIKCGGQNELYQKREQWQAGTNFFTISPGKIIGYGMNYHTYDELAKAGIPRVEAADAVTGRVDLDAMDRYAIAISGNELSRGGGGCRCMTMPALRT